MKELAILKQEYDLAILEEITARKREYAEEEAMERLARQEEFDFERDCGARP